MEQLECFRNEEELNLYLDDELGAGRKLELKTHLMTCEKCASRFEIYHNLKSAVKRSASEVHAPAWLKDKIIHSINEEKSPDPGAFWGGMQDGVELWDDVGKGMVKSVLLPFTMRRAF